MVSTMSDARSGSGAVLAVRRIATGVRSGVCVCVFGFTDVYQSDMIIYVWGPTFNVTIRVGVGCFFICFEFTVCS